MPALHGNSNDNVIIVLGDKFSSFAENNSVVTLSKLKQYAIAIFACCVVYPNLMTIGVSEFPDIAGLASSILGFSLVLSAALVMALSSLLMVASIMPLFALFLLLLAAAWPLLRAIRS